MPGADGRAGSVKSGLSFGDAVELFLSRFPLPMIPHTDTHVRAILQRVRCHGQSAIAPSSQAPGRRVGVERVLLPLAMQGPLSMPFAVTHPCRAVRTPSCRKSRCSGTWASEPIEIREQGRSARRNSSTLMPRPMKLASTSCSNAQWSPPVSPCRRARPSPHRASASPSALCRPLQRGQLSPR